MSNCMEILVAKLTVEGYSNAIAKNNDTTTELPIDDPVTYYDEWVELSTVAKVTEDKTMVMDEGDSRIVYIETVITITAVLTDSTRFGNFIDETDNDQEPVAPFNKRIESISRLLSNQGLGIHFGGYPITSRRVQPGDENRGDIDSLPFDEDPGTPYTGHKGWLVDNFNGPKTVMLTFEPMSGSEAVMMTWKVKYRTSQMKEDLIVPGSDELIIPKISSEVRMDVGKDGDIRIIVAGTIYGDSLEDIYKARDFLDIRYRPSTIEKLKVGNIAQWQADEWAMMNGFTKEVQFNIDKTGRSATFSITYSQVHSNSAFPIGLTDVTFDQTLESSLFANSAWQGKGFYTWKNSFKGKIVIPPRLPADYAWYIMHMLISQQLRKAEIKIDSSVRTEGKAEETGKEIVKAQNDDDDEGKAERQTTAFPIRMKINHKHFKREIAFEMDYILFCPLHLVHSQSCIFSRVNNDYHQKLLNPERTYLPLSLSEQWLAWSDSTDIGYGFDPTQPNATRPDNPGKPHRDTAGTEIIDTGHNYDAYKKLEDQEPQRWLFVSTVGDPNDSDPDYTETPEDPTTTRADQTITNIPSSSAYYLDRKTLDSLSVGENDTYETMGNNYNGVPQDYPRIQRQVTRPKVRINPRASWMHYSQDYEIIESNATVSTQSLADVSVDDYKVSEDYRKKLRVNDRDGSGGWSGSDTKLGAENITAASGFGQHGSSGVRLASGDYMPPDRNANEEAPGHWEQDEKDAYDELPIRHRKTYAAKAPRHYVKVKGTAIRAGYKIPIPRVIKIAGEMAIKVGEGRMKHKNVAPDADVPVYLAMWEFTYTVDKDLSSEDILSTIEDTGANVLYVG